jgi:hypothetical protein
MTERERLARVLHDAHSTWRATPLLHWEDTPEVHALYLCMADAVLADQFEQAVREEEAMEARLEAAEQRVAEAQALIAGLRELLALACQPDTGRDAPGR